MADQATPVTAAFRLYPGVGSWLTARYSLNPALAGMMALVIVSLFGGTAVATYFAIDATEHARRADREKNDAVAAKYELPTAQFAFAPPPAPVVAAF